MSLSPVILFEKVLSGDVHLLICKTGFYYDVLLLGVFDKLVSMCKSFSYNRDIIRESVLGGSCAVIDTFSELEDAKRFFNELVDGYV